MVPAVASPIAADVSTLHQQHLDRIQQFRRPSDLGSGQDTVYDSIASNLQGDWSKLSGENGDLGSNFHHQMKGICEC